MITSAYERTGTILDYGHGTRDSKERWFSGLIIQLPEVDEEGRFVRDESTGILKARDIYEAALPIESDNIKNYPPELANCFNTLHGMDDAIKQLPDYAWFWANPEGLRNVVRGYWLCGDPGYRRVDVYGVRRPSDSLGVVASRVAAEIEKH